jgi:hypothetical protein
MAILNRERGYLFLSAPHCASRAISQALQLHPGSTPIGQHDTFAELSGKNSLVQEPLFKFCVIRHPLDWLVTRYLHLTSFQKHGFKEFVRHQTTDGMLDNVIFVHAKDCNRIARYETLEHDLNLIVKRFGLEIGTLPTVGKTAGKRDYREYYDLEDVERVRSYLKGRETYGYSV